MALQVRQGDEFEGGGVGCFENHRRGHPGLQGFGPAGDAEAPAVSGVEAWEVGAYGGGEVVASAGAEFQEVIGHDRADHMGAHVVAAGMTAAVAIEPGRGVGAAGLEWSAEDVSGL